MQFQVPQFIEVEDKIFGPLTFRQFIYVAGGLGTCYLIARLLPLFLAAPIILAVGGLAAGLAFLEYNGRPLIHALEDGFFYLIRRKLYLWRNKHTNIEKPAPAVGEKAPESKVYVPRLSESRLHELAWSLDIKERIAEGVVEDANTETEEVSLMKTARSAMVR